MEQFSLILTILFVLLGPLKIISPFAALMRGVDERFKRAVALRGALIALAACVFVALAGETLLTNYHISLDALRISGGLVLMLSALNAIFPKAQSLSPSPGTPTAIQLAVSPVAVPMILSHAGVAAILIFTLMATQRSETRLAIAICLAIILVLDFLVMYFINQVTKKSGLMLTLQVLGSILAFIQVAMAIQIILAAFKSMGVIKA